MIFRRFCRFSLTNQPLSTLYNSIDRYIYIYSKLLIYKGFIYCAAMEVVDIPGHRPLHVTSVAVHRLHRERPFWRFWGEYIRGFSLDTGVQRKLDTISLCKSTTCILECQASHLSTGHFPLDTLDSLANQLLTK